MKNHIFAALMAVTIPLIATACGGDEPTPMPTPDSGTVDPPDNPDVGPTNPAVCNVENPCNEGYACMDTVCTQNAAVSCSGFNWLTQNPDTEFLCRADGGALRTLTYRVRVLPEDQLGTCLVEDDGGSMQDDFRFPPEGGTGRSTAINGTGVMSLDQGADTFQVTIPPQGGSPQIVWVCQR